MTSTERVLEYKKLDQERSLETLPNNQPDDGWPDRGAVSFRDVTFSYRDDDKQVLRDVSFDVAPGEKVRKHRFLSLMLFYMYIGAKYCAKIVLKMCSCICAAELSLACDWQTGISSAIVGRGGWPHWRW